MSLLIKATSPQTILGRWSRLAHPRLRTRPTRQYGCVSFGTLGSRLRSPGGWGRTIWGLLGALVNPDPVAWEVEHVTKSARDGFALVGSARTQIAIHKSEGVIMVLLGQLPWPADWAGPVPAAPARPDTPVRVRIVRDAEILPLIARELGQAEQALFGSLASLGPGPRTVRDVQYVDFTLAAGDGFVVDSPALPQIAVGKTADAINVLLIPALSDRAPDPDPDPDPFPFRPYGDMGPLSRSRRRR
jgi:hypothetical protein